jgi:hypothetical protein
LQAACRCISFQGLADRQAANAKNKKVIPACCSRLVIAFFLSKPLKFIYLQTIFGAVKNLLFADSLFRGIGSPPGRVYWQK